MGRGRAKAKQTKVARQLKYNSGGFDASRLSQELGVPSNEPVPVNGEPFEDEDEDDPYGSYADYYSDEGDGEDGSRSRRGA
ncbi:DUF3073 domain-containing protein [Streptomyces sp. NPDC092296]|uniref:DUF3073 domain-containing protein n=1 Tax=Streptomyces sp. NPDC092296 TaxID=3366012 RepID=UPI0038280D7B